MSNRDKIIGFSDESYDFKFPEINNSEKIKKYFLLKICTKNFFFFSNFFLANCNKLLINATLIHF